MDTVLIESTEDQVVIGVDRHQIEADYLSDLQLRLKKDLAQHRVSVDETDVVMDGQFDTYQASLPVLSKDWDAPENDYWD